MANDGSLFLNSADCAEYEFTTKNKQIFEDFAKELEVLLDETPLNANVAQVIYTIALEINNKLDSDE